MVARRTDGRLRFDLASAINLLPILMTIILSAWVLSAQLKTVEVTVGSNRERIVKLEKFKDQGDRYTAAQGKEQDRRIMVLEEVQKNNPPDWYEDQVAEAIGDLKSNIKTIAVEVNDLKIGIRLLEQTVRLKIPNGK